MAEVAEILRLAFESDGGERLLDDLAARIAVHIADHLPDNTDDTWMDTKAAAVYAGCSVDSLYKAMQSGELPPPGDGLPGRKAYFKRQHIDAWREGR